MATVDVDITKNENNNDDSSNYFSPEVISQFFENGTGLNQTVLWSLVASENNNPLRQTLINHVNKGLHKKIFGKKFTNTLVIPENLDSEAQNKLQSMFSEINIVFTNSLPHSHDFAAASRKCERLVLLNKLNYHNHVDRGKILIKDIGGNHVASVLTGERNIHSCSPLIDNYDGTRLSQRIYRAITEFDSGAVESEYVKEALGSYLTNYKTRTATKHFCFDKGQYCQVKANALMFLHSNYDMSLTDVANSMESASAIIAYGSFIFHSSILTDDEGNIPWINASFKISRNILGKRSMIRFGFVGCNGFNYEHNYNNYLSYLVCSQFRSTKGSRFSLELLENREGIQFFRVTRLLYSIGKPLTHRLNLTHMKDKYLVRFPYLHYKMMKDRGNYSLPTGMSGRVNTDHKNKIFWDNIPKTAEWISLLVDCEIIDRTCAYVLGYGEEKFKPEQIISYLRSVTTREATFNSVTKKNKLPPVDALAVIAHAIYITLYQTKYVYGKALQQAIHNVNSTRLMLNPLNLLKEFDQYVDRWWFMKVLDWLMGNNNGDFDPKRFIEKPPDYLEYETTSIFDTISVLKTDTIYFPCYDTDDLIITSKVVKDLYPEIREDSKYDFKLSDLDKVLPHPKHHLDNTSTFSKLNNVVVSKEITNIAREVLLIAQPIEGLTVDEPPSVAVDSTDVEANLTNHDQTFDNKENQGDFLKEDVNFDLEFVLTMVSDKLKKKFLTSDDTMYSFLTKVYNHSYNCSLKVYSRTYDLHRLKFFINRSAYKLLEILFVYNIQVPSKVLDMCGAPGGFVQLLNVLGVEHVTSFSKGKYNNMVSNYRNSKVFETDIDDVELFDTYDLILADGANEYSYCDDSIFFKEYNLAVNHLNIGGVLIIKHNSYFSASTNITYPFGEVNVYKPKYSMEGNTEVYFIMTGYDPHLDTRASIIEAATTCLEGISGYYNQDRTKRIPVIKMKDEINHMLTTIINDRKTLAYSDPGLPPSSDLPSSELTAQQKETTDTTDFSDDRKTLAYSDPGLPSSELTTQQKDCIEDSTTDFSDCESLPELPVVPLSVDYLTTIVSPPDMFLDTVASPFKDFCDMSKLSPPNHAVTDVDGCPIVDTVVLTDYPRHDNLSIDGLINVDGRKLECCVLAVCEDRSIDVDFIKSMLFMRYKPERNTDLYNELQAGNMSGSAFIECFSDYYCVSVNVCHNGECYYFTPSTKFNMLTMRTITVILTDEHYYYKPQNCFYPNDVRKPIRNSMFKPFVIPAYLNGLSKIVDFVDVSTSKVIVPNQINWINNLDIYCSQHTRCKFGNALYYLKSLSTNSTKLILTFEEDNFDIVAFVELLTTNDLTCVDITYIDYKYDGYITVLFSYCSQSKFNPARLLSDFDGFKAHICQVGGNVTINNNGSIILSCSNDPSTVMEGISDHADLVIKLINDGAESKEESSRSLTICSRASGPSCENVNKVAMQITDYIGRFSPKSYLIIQLLSDFANVQSIVSMLKTRCRYLFIHIKPTKHYNSDLVLNYYPDSLELNRRRNAMLEAWSVWHYQREAVTNQLKNLYQTMVPSVTNGERVLGKIDNSAVLLDTVSGKYIRGDHPEASYDWGYDGQNLISTTEFFNAKGLVNMELVNNLAKAGKRYISFNSSSKLVHGIKFSELYHYNDVKELVDVPLVFVHGVPGAGKTEYILNKNFCKLDNLILTVTKEACKDMYNRAKGKKLNLRRERIRTIDSFLLHEWNHGDIDEVWIDEALMVHAGDLCWVIHKSKCNKLYVVGDMAQIPYINRYGLSVHYSTLNSWDFDRELLNVDHRNPLDIVKWLNDEGFYDFSVRGSSSVVRSVDVVHINGVREVPKSTENYVKYLTFTQPEKKSLLAMGYNVNTVHEYQGNQASEIILVRLVTKEADPIYSSNPHILVALTRHRKRFTYYTVNPSDKVCNYIIKIKNYNVSNIKSIHKDHLLGGKEVVVTPDYSLTTYLQNKIIRNQLLKNDGSTYISTTYNVNRQLELRPLIVDYSYSSVGFGIFQDFLDRIYTGASSEFREFDHDHFEFTPQPIDIDNIKLDMSLPIFKNYDYMQSKIRSTLQYPLHQSQKLSMKAFYERNGNVPQLQGLIDSWREATLLFRDLKKTFTHQANFSEFPITFNFKNFSEWISGQPNSVLKAMMSDEQFFDSKFTLYNFIIKTVPKIDLEVGAEYRYKAPQTIAFQSKTVNSVFCPVLKELMDRFETLLHEDILLYNGLSPQEFASELDKIFPDYRANKCKVLVEIDFSKYDKSQGLVILIFEALLMEYFGVPLEYIKIWIVMHRETTLLDRLNRFSSTVQYQRKSGDAGTWRLNTIVSLATLNRVYRLYERLNNHSAVLCFSGDDSLIFLEDPISNFKQKTTKLQYIYNLEAKVVNYNTPYFCSKFLMLTEDGWIFVPDTVKLLIKLGRNDLVNVKHIEEYRISFEDNLYFYKNKRNWPHISKAINDRYKLTGEHDIVYSALLTIAQDSNKFKNLYFTPLCYKPYLGGNSNLPNLDI